MAKKRLGQERVVGTLRQIEVLTAGGKALPLACKEAGITDVTCLAPYTDPRTFGILISRTQKAQPQWLG
jgi:hypothetical protein